MSAPTFADQIPLAVKLITADDTYDVEWRDAMSEFRKPEHVNLTIVSDLRRGWDEVRIKPKDGDPTAVVESISGNRSLTIQFFCESDEQPIGAQTLAEDLQIGLARQDVRELLSLANLGACSLGPCMNASYTDDDGDRIAAVMFEATFPRTVTRTGATISRVDTVEVEGTITHEDASETTIGPFEVTKP